MTISQNFTCAAAIFFRIATKQQRGQAGMPLT